MYDYLEKLSHDELINIIKEKNDYLSLMVHQLRTPLTAEKWFLEIVVLNNKDIRLRSQKKRSWFSAFLYQSVNVKLILCTLVYLLLLQNSKETSELP